MLLRTGSIAAISGAIVLLVAEMLHPMSADPADAAAAFAEYAADRLWIASHLGAFLGVALMVVGLYALSCSLRDEPAGWASNLGLLVATAALAVTALLQAVDGIALKAMVDRWASAPEAHKQSAFDAALAVRHIEIGIASLSGILFGAACALFGAALCASARYPAWLGWLAVAAGVGTAVGSVLTAFAGFSSLTMAVTMPSGLAVIAWLGLAGVAMWRRAPPRDMRSDRSGPPA
jgi:hypothetical protein